MGAKAIMLANPYTYKFLKGLTHSALINLLAKKNNYFRSTRRQDGYEALESANLKEVQQSYSQYNPNAEMSKIRNGFADVFNQFQSYGSQTNVNFG